MNQLNNMIPEYTNLTDVNGKKIYVGDTVRKEWGIWMGKKQFQDHVIRVVQEDNRRCYNLGPCYNIWRSGEVEKIAGYNDTNG